MRQAITTKYFGPSNVRGSRVKATADAGSITLHWDNALNTEQNHALAARKLAAKLGWVGQWIGGSLPGSGYAFVMVDEFARHSVDFFNVTNDDVAS